MKLHVQCDAGKAAERVDFSPNLQSILKAGAAAGSLGAVTGLGAVVTSIGGILVGGISSIINRGSKGNSIMRETFQTALRAAVPGITLRNLSYGGFEIVGQVQEGPMRQFVESVKAELYKQAQSLSREGRREFGGAVASLEISATRDSRKSHIFEFELYQPPVQVPRYEANEPAPTRPATTHRPTGTTHVPTVQAPRKQQPVSKVSTHEPMQLQSGLFIVAGIALVGWLSR